jgi:hypothetical protein
MILDAVDATLRAPDAGGVAAATALASRVRALILAGPESEAEGVSLLQKHTGGLEAPR